MLASTHKRRRFLVPSSAFVQLSAVSAQLSDDHLQLARVIGQVAERLGEPKIGEWLSPYLLACMSRHETLSGMLSAIVDEQP